MELKADIDEIRDQIQKNHDEHSQSGRKTMSVPEMRKLLGVKKTESYWLVHKGYFKTSYINGVMRVDLESFEEWYANQVKHKKVNGEKPGKVLCQESYSFRDAANLLGIHSSNLYEIWRNEGLDFITVDYVKRIPVDVFEEWYKNQIMYKKVDVLPTISELEENYIPIGDAANSLGITREKMAAITRISAFKDVFEIIVYEDKKWISKKSFQQFLNAQSVYQVVSENKEDSDQEEQLVTKEYISVKEAAALAGVTSSTIIRWAGLGHFAFKVVGRGKRIHREAFLSFLNSYNGGAN